MHPIRIVRLSTGPPESRNTICSKWSGIANVRSAWIGGKAFPPLAAFVTCVVDAGEPLTMLFVYAMPSARHCSVLRRLTPVLNAHTAVPIVRLLPNYTIRDRGVWASRSVGRTRHTLFLYMYLTSTPLASLTLRFVHTGCVALRSGALGHVAL